YGCVRSGGVVGDHAPESRARTGGDVGAETKPVRSEKEVELVEHHSGAHADGAPVEVQVGDAAVVARELYDQAVTNRAADEAGAGAARDEGNAGLAGGADYRTGLGGVAGKGHPRWFDLINRRVGRVEL